MKKINMVNLKITYCVMFCIVLLLGGCAGKQPMLQEVGDYAAEAPLYLIGPGDNVNVFVWGNADLSATVPVRPDGKITTPLVEDIQASGKTPTELAREMEKHLAKYIKNPIVTVYVAGFVGRYTEQIRVIGQAAKPQSLPFNDGMTVLDVVIASGGLTEFAAGNRTTIVRTVNGEQKQFRARLDDLVNGGDISANVSLMPGDIIIIPEAWF